MPDTESLHTVHDADIPADLKVKLAEQKLIVTWKDGRQSSYELAWLRKICPCATCKTEREAQAERPRSLTILRHDPLGIRAVDAHLVGHYAIQFQWSDGHNTGIYDFKSLRALSAS